MSAKSTITIVMGLFVLLTTLGLGLAPGTADATSHDIYELNDGDQHWYDTTLVYKSSNVVKGEDWTLVGGGGETITKTAGQDGAVYFDPNNFSDFTDRSVDLQNPSGSTVLTFSLSSQTMSVSATRTTVTLNEDPQTEVTVDSNRQDPPYTIVVSEANGNLTADQIANLSSSFTNDNGTVKYTGASGSETFNLDFSNVEAGKYNLAFDSNDTRASDSIQITVEVSADATIESNGLYWIGQLLEYKGTNVDPNTTYRLYNTTDSTLVREVDSNSSGQIIIDTGDLKKADYEIRDTNGNTLVAFLLEEQTINTSFSENTVLNEGVDTVQPLNFESNRSTYDVAIEISGLSPSEVATRVPNATVKTIEISGTTKERAIITGVSDSEDIDFRNLETGQYTVTATVVDTAVSSSSEIEVRQLEEGTPSFEKQFYYSAQTDTAKITFRMPSGATDSKVVIGGSEGRIYRAELEFTNKKPSAGALVTLKIDTLLAGQGKPKKTFDYEFEKISSGDSDDSTSTSPEIQMNIVQETQIDVEVLANTRYLLRIYSGGTERDISALVHEEIGVKEPTPYLIPQTTTYDDIQTTETEEETSDGGTRIVEKQREEPFYTHESVSQANEFAEEDTLYMTYEVSGISQYVFRDSRTAGDFAEGTTFAQNSGITIKAVSTEDRMNREPLEVDPSSLVYKYDERHNIIAFGFRPSVVDSLEKGTYKVTFKIDERHPAIKSEDQTIKRTKKFTVVDGTVNFGEEPVEVTPTQDVKITADTTYAPSTQTVMVLRSDSLQYPFLSTSEVTVTDDFKMEGTFDLRGAPVDEDFTVFVRDLEGEADVNVVSTDSGEEEEDQEQDTQEGTVNVPLSLVDENGNQISGTIEFNDQSISADGQTQAELPVGETITFTGNSEGYNSNTIQVEITQDQERINIQLEKQTTQTYNVEVKTLDAETGEELTTAQVSVNSSKIQDVGDDATALYNLEEGDYTFRAQADGYQRASRTITVDDNRNIVLELQPKEDGGTETPSGTEDESTATQTQSQNTGGDTQTQEETRAPGQPGFQIITMLFALVGFMVLVKFRG